MTWALSDVGILSGTVLHPAQGTWTADIEINTGESMGGAQTLQLPGVELKGYVVSGGVSDLRQRLRVVGGRGGLSRTVKGQHFNRATAQTVVNYLLSACGETLDAASDAALLAQKVEHWQHTTSSAGHGLDELLGHLGATWYVTPTGDVHVGDPDWLEKVPDHVLLAEDLSAGSWTISCIDDTILPGSSFLGKRVGAVEHVISPTEARTHVRWGTSKHPFDEALQQAVRRVQDRTLCAYDAEVVSQDAQGFLDLKPADSSVGPGWQHVPLYFVGTASVKVAPGARCLVEFMDNRRDKPFVRSFLSGTFTEISETAQTLKLKGSTTASLDGPSVAVGGTATDVRLGKGTNFVAAVGDPTATGGAIVAPVANTVVKV